MITTTLKALTSFLTFGKEMVDKVSASFDFKVLSKAKVDALFYSLLKLESLSGDTKFEFMKRQTKYNERMSK